MSHTASGRTSPSAEDTFGSYFRIIRSSGSERRTESICRPEYPEAYSPPTIAPMLVPTTRSGFNPRLSITCRTPMWANPFAPPPESTSAVFAGEQPWARTSGGTAPNAANDRTSSRRRTIARSLTGIGRGGRLTYPPMNLPGSGAFSAISGGQAAGTLNAPALAPVSAHITGLAMWAVVFAVGIGSRFWPLSTSERPKPLLALVTGNSLLEDTVGRLQPLIPPERVIVVTSRDIAPAIREAIRDVPEENILVEPRPLGTAAAGASAEE